MTKILIAGFICLLSTSPLQAQETDHSQLAAQFAHVLGFETMLLNFKTQAQQSADQQFSQMMEQFNKSFSNIPPEFMKELKEAGVEFARKSCSGWDALEAAHIYSSALAESLPETELRKSIEHYRTPEGQNQLKAINAAGARLNAYILDRIQKTSQDANQEFIHKVRLIVNKAQQNRKDSKRDQD